LAWGAAGEPSFRPFDVIWAQKRPFSTGFVAAWLSTSLALQPLRIYHPSGTCVLLTMIFGRVRALLFVCV
jgi:hypothetical protein